MPSVGLARSRVAGLRLDLAVHGGTDGTGAYRTALGDPKPRYLVAGLAPAVLLTAVLSVALALMAGDDLLASVVTWALVLNVVGSAGDMLMMRKVMSYPRVTRFEDTGDGFVAYAPREHPLDKP